MPPILTQYCHSKWVTNYHINYSLCRPFANYVLRTVISLFVFRNLSGTPDTWYINSLVPGRSGCDFKNSNFILVLFVCIFRSPHDNALGWMPWDLTDGKSTLVEVMAWCRQATSHYLSQSWSRSLLPYGVTRPQWVQVRTKWLTFWEDNVKYIFLKKICLYGLKFLWSLFLGSNWQCLSIGSGNGLAPNRRQAIIGFSWIGWIGFV